MAVRIFWNSPRGTMTSAISKVIERPWRAILAPIFTNRSRSVVIDQSSASAGMAYRCDQTSQPAVESGAGPWHQGYTGRWLPLLPL
jgi:hypothetical protein